MNPATRFVEAPYRKLNNFLWVVGGGGASDCVDDVCAGIYFACVMILCTMSVSMAVLVLNLHNRTPDAYTMPAAVRAYSFHSLRYDTIRYDTRC